MPNIAKILKEEIQRLARHEIKVAMMRLQKDNSALKKTVTDLKKRLAAMESEKKHMAKSQPGSNSDISNDEIKSARITAKMIRAIRSRLGLSQGAFSKLAGVSSQAVYQWERANGRLRFRGDGKARIIAIRNMGKREVKQRMAELQIS